MKKIIIALLVLISHATMAQLSTSLSQNKPKTIIQDGNCRIQFIDSTGTQVHEMLCSQLKFWYEKSYPYFGGKKITIFDGYNKIYIENDGSLTSPTFANLDDSLNVWKQCEVGGTGTDPIDYSGKLDTIITLLTDSLDKQLYVLNPYIDSAIVRRMDTTNALLKQFYFENCGNAIPSTHIGWDFDLPVDFGTTDATDTWFHLLELSSLHFYPPSISYPTTPILVDGNETAINSFIQSSLIADGYVGDELILVVNPDKTITIWASPSYVPNGDEFWLGTSTPDTYTNKLFPTIPTVNQGGGVNNALLVKVCEPLNVEVSFPADIEYNINETFDINNSTVVFPGNTIHSYTIIGITGTYDLTEVSSILAIPAGVTQTSTADGYLQNDVTVFTTGRVIIKTIR